MVVVLNPVAVTETSDMALVSSKAFLDIQATIKCRFILICVRDMIITCNQRQYLTKAILMDGLSRAIRIQCLVWAHHFLQSKNRKAVVGSDTVIEPLGKIFIFTFIKSSKPA